MSSILIKNGRVWDGECFFDADVLILDDKIHTVAPHIEESADFTYDACGKTVSAGLVDAHVHMRGISCDNFGIHAEMSCFPFGVTAAADAAGELGNKALLDSFMLKNTVFVCSRFRDNKADFTEAEKMLKLYGDKAVGIKVCFDTASCEVRDITPLREVCDYARKVGLKVMVHCTNSPVAMKEILETLSAGDILTHAFHGGKNTAAADNFECIKAAGERGVVIDVGMAGYVHTDFGIFGKAIKSGIIADVISSDITKLSAYKRGGRYGLTACMSIARFLGMCEDDIFRAVTSNAALALGKENEWGYLKVGRTADVSVLDFTDEGFDMTDASGNRVYSTEGYRCVLTVSDGQVVYKY